MRAFSAVGESLRVLRAFLTDSSRRQAIRAAMSTDRSASVAESETSSVEPERLSAYSGLTPFSDAFLRATFRQAPPRINVVLPEFDPAGVFAGVKTALESAAILGELSGRPVRLVLLAPGEPRPDARARRVRSAETWLGEHFGSVAWSVLHREDLDDAGFGTDDSWLVTHWWTAHAIDVAARLGRVDPRDVIYLVQDYEPGFVGLSTESAIAESTYHAGFRMIVNSRPLARHLAARGIEVVDELVFAPNFDLDELRRTAQQRVAGGDPVRVFFYGRPAKPRNMYALGIAALRLAAEQLAASEVPVEFIMAGEAGDDVDLGAATMRNLGVLPREEYFRLLASVDAALSLQATPHPSHPPFDLAITGAQVVVNDIEGTRDGLHPRIRAVAAHPQALADALVAAVEAARGGSADYLPVAPGLLGEELRTVLELAWEQTARQSSAPPQRRAAPLRWSIRTAAPQGPSGDVWGDTQFAADLASALRAEGREVMVHRLGEDPPVDAEVVLSLRGLARTRPHPTARNVIWVISHPDLVTLDELADNDLAFAASESWAARMDAAGIVPVQPLLQATDPFRFHPGEADAAVAADLLFVGNTRDVFRPIVRDTIEVGGHPVVYGGGWEQLIDPRRIRAPFLDTARVAAAYRSAGIVLNDHWDDMRDNGFLSNRLFDAVASGARVITDPIEGLERFGGSARSYADADELRELLTSAANWPDAGVREQNAKRVAREDSFAARAVALIAAIGAEPPSGDPAGSPR